MDTRELKHLHSNSGRMFRALGGAEVEPDVVGKAEEASKPQTITSSNSSSSSSLPPTSGERKRKAGESMGEFTTLPKKYKDQTDQQWREHVLARIVENAEHSQGGRELVVHEVHERDDQPAADCIRGWGRIHHTHRRCVIKDMLFCRRCGKWTTTRLSEVLRKPCEGRAQEQQKHRLTRMCAGLDPLNSVKAWADGTPTEIQCRVRALDLGGGCEL